MEQGGGGRKAQFALAKNGESYKLMEGVNLVGRKNPNVESQAVQVALEVKMVYSGQFSFEAALQD